MIRNDRQLAIAREKRQALLSEASLLQPSDAAVYRDLADEVQQEVDEYVAIRDGHVNLFAIESVDDLRAAAIKARLARGWTQRQLADSLGVSEQMVQKDESRGYEKAGVARLAEIVDVLGYQLVGELRPTYLSPDQWKGPGGIVIGIPSGNWATHPLSLEVGFITPLPGNVQISMSGFLAPMGAYRSPSASYGFRLRSGVTELGPSGVRGNRDASQSLVKG